MISEVNINIPLSTLSQQNQTQIIHVKGSCSTIFYLDSWLAS